MGKRLICLIWIGLAASLLGISAKAEDAGSPEALQAANELAAIMSKDLLAQMTSQMTAQVWPQIEAKFQGSVDAATVADLRVEFERVVLNFVTQSLKEMPVLYAKYFTVQEIHDMVGFYRTTTGQKTLQLMPKVMGEFYGTMLPRLATMQQEIQQAAADVMTKHGYPKSK